MATMAVKRPKEVSKSIISARFRCSRGHFIPDACRPHVESANVYQVSVKGPLDSTVTYYWLVH